MDEKTFWTFYVKSRFFNKNRSAAEGSKTDNPLDKYYEEEEAMDIDMETNVTEPVLSRLVDIKATEEDHFSDYGNKTLQHIKSQEGEASISLIKKFNIHSMKVIQASTGDSVHTTEKIEDAIALQDLEMKEEPEPIPLNISPSTIFGYKSGGQIPAPTEEQHKEYEEMIGEFPLDLTQFAQGLLKTNEEHKELMGDLLKNVYDPSNERRPLPSVDTLPPEVLIFHKNACEVLCHFWQTFPSKNQGTDTKVKLVRLTTILYQMEIKGKEIISSQTALRQQSMVENALFATMQSIECALRKYREKTGPIIDQK